MKQRKTDVHLKLIKRSFSNNPAYARRRSGGFWLSTIGQPVLAGLKFESASRQAQYEERRDTSWEHYEYAYEYLYIFDVSYQEQDVIQTYNAIAVVDESRGQPIVKHFAIGYGRTSFRKLINMSVHEPSEFTFAHKDFWLNQDRSDITKAGVGLYEIEVQEKYSRQGYAKAVFNSSPLFIRETKDAVLDKLSYSSRTSPFWRINFSNLKIFRSKVNRLSDYVFVGVEKDTPYGDRYISVRAVPPKGLSFQDKVDFYREVVRILKKVNR